MLQHVRCSISPQSCDQSRSYWGDTNSCIGSLSAATFALKPWCCSLRAAASALQPLTPVQLPI